MTRTKGRVAPQKQRPLRYAGYAVALSRMIFLDQIRSTKRRAIAAYVAECDKGWTWKKLYALGARCVRVSLVIKVHHKPKKASPEGPGK